MNNIIKQEDIERKIYTIRGVEVMLDSDLAKIYDIETKRINESVRRNQIKFPERFSWILTDDESREFLVANCDQKKETRGGRYKNPRVFTEQGVAMLSTILSSKKAIETSISIIDAFVHMRHYFRMSNDVLPNRVMLLEEKVDDNTKRINELFDKFEPKEILKDRTIYKGGFFDSHLILLDIFDYANEEIIIIDNYAGKELLNIIKDIKKKIIIVSSNIDKILKEKYEKQYNNVKFIINSTYHDRFILIDRKRLFHSGASFKDLGKKCFDIHEIDDIQSINDFIGKLPSTI